VTRPVAAVLHAHATALAAALGDWDARGTASGAGPNTAANTAIALMDAMLDELHRARTRLIDEKRAYNDRLDAAVDGLLSRSRRERSE
jgi:hypothetical protein